MSPQDVSSKPRLGLIGASVLSAAMVLGACQVGGGFPTPSGLDEQQEQLATFAELRRVREAELAQMTVRELAAELQKDSVSGLEPFNSMAMREMVSRGEGVAPDLRRELSAEDRSSLLGLLALGEMSRAEYGELDASFRLAVLVDALRTSEFFNTWGLPHLYWEDAAQAIIDEGAAAERPLQELLDDRRPAPMWGQEEVIEYETYQYRVADYALALILAIRGEEAAVPVDPADRDRLIADL